MPRNPRKPYERPDERGSAPDGVWLHDRADAMEVDRQSRRRMAPAAAVSSKIVVSNLHYEVTVKDLIAIFGQVGTLVRDPNIRYDRSGRSTGVAIITFETAEEARAAQEQFDGILAKGQPMAISYDTSVPSSRPRTRSTSAPPSSLMNRLEKAPLSDRVARDDPMTNGGPIRSRGRRAGGRRGGSADPPAPRRKPAPGPVAKGGRQPRGKPKPKTAEDLDKELDAFMNTDTVASQKEAGKDVEMTVA